MNNFQEWTTKKYHLVIQNRPVCRWKKWCFTWQLCTRGTRPASKDLGLTQPQTSKRNSMRTTLTRTARISDKPTDARSSFYKRPVGLNGQVLAHNLWQSIFCFTLQASPHPLTVWCPIQHGWSNISRRRCLRTCLQGCAAAVPCRLDEGCVAAVPYGAWQVNLQVRVREALKPRRSCSIPGARGQGCRQQRGAECGLAHRFTAQVSSSSLTQGSPSFWPSEHTTSQAPSIPATMRNGITFLMVSSCLTMSNHWGAMWDGAASIQTVFNGILTACHRMSMYGQPMKTCRFHSGLHLLSPPAVWARSSVSLQQVSSLFPLALSSSNHCDSIILAPTGSSRAGTYL